MNACCAQCVIDAAEELLDTMEVEMPRLKALIDHDLALVEATVEMDDLIETLERRKRFDFQTGATYGSGQFSWWRYWDRHLAKVLEMRAELRKHMPVEEAPSAAGPSWTKDLKLRTDAFEIDEESRSIKVVASTSEVDRDGDIIEADGCDLSEYRRNPVVLFHHKADQPIGRACDDADNLTVRHKGNRIIAKLFITDDDAWEKIRNGSLMGVSVGFKPLEYKPIKGGGNRVSKWKLLEISLTPLPSNQSATICRVGECD